MNEINFLIIPIQKIQNSSIKISNLVEIKRNNSKGAEKKLNKELD
jgi:hypothetical protein